MLKSYVYNEDLNQKPGVPSYFGGDFFRVIRELKNVYDLELISTKKIYSFLIDSKIKVDPFDLNSNYRPLKCENKNPLINWKYAWKNARTRGLKPDLSSFLLKMIWNILPTEQRVARIFNTSFSCKYCAEKNSIVEEGSLEHFLVFCPENLDLSKKLIGKLEKVSDIDSKKLITFSMKFKEKKEYPWIWLAGTFLEKLWTLKKSKKFSKLEIKSQIMVDLSIQKKYLLDIIMGELRGSFQILLIKIRTKIWIGERGGMPGKI